VVEIDEPKVCISRDVRGIGREDVLSGLEGALPIDRKVFGDETSSKLGGHDTFGSEGAQYEFPDSIVEGNPLSRPGTEDY
jgi:hypothetical protein